MAALTSQTIASTYLTLLKLTTAALGADASGKFIEDAAGTDSALSLSTTRVGIGTAAPLTLLHVETSAAGTPHADADEFLIASNAGHSGMTILSKSDSTANIYFGDSDDTDIGKIAYNNNVNELEFYTNTALRMLIDDAGKVGIGTANPRSTLDVSMSTQSTTIAQSLARGITLTVNEGGQVLNNDFYPGLAWYLDDSNVDADERIAGGITLQAAEEANGANKAGSDMRFYNHAGNTNSGLTERLAILEDGEINFSEMTYFKATGKTNATTSIQIVGSADGDNEGAIFHSYLSAGGSDTTTQIGARFHTSQHETTKAVSYIRLTASDQEAAWIWMDDDALIKGSTTETNVGTTTGTALSAALSDERLKTISSDPFPYGLLEVNKLTPIKFKVTDYKDTRDRLGFGAQTIQPIIPETVQDTKECIHGYDEIKTDENGELLELSKWHTVAKGDASETKLVMEYHQLIPVLVKAIQELSAKVTALENA